MVLNNVPSNPGKSEMDDLQTSINEINDQTTDLENGSANTEWQQSEPSESNMVSGKVYVWPNSEGFLEIGGLDEDTGNKVVTSTQVSVEDPGLVGGIVGGLF